MRDYQVQSGDTLMKIAQAELGDELVWPLLYAINKDAIDKAYEMALPELRRIKAKHIGHPSDYLQQGHVLQIPNDPRS